MAEGCIRKQIEIDGENYYIIQGEDIVHITVPYENRPENLKERKSADILCQEVLNIANTRLKNEHNDTENGV